MNTEVIHINDGAMCSQELSEEYREHCRKEFIKFKKDNPDAFKNEHMDINDIFNKFINGERFSFCRFSDGEYLLMKPKYRFVSRDDVLIPGKKTKLGEKLKEIITHNEENFKVGVVMEWFPWVPHLTPDCLGMIHENFNTNELWSTTVGGGTMAESGFDYSHPRINDVLQFLIANKYDMVLIANENTKVNNVYLNIKEFFPIPTDGIDYFERKSEVFLNDIRSLINRHNNTVFVMGAGMLANVICYEGWKLNKTNWYLDFGLGVRHMAEWKSE